MEDVLFRYFNFNLSKYKGKIYDSAFKYTPSYKYDRSLMNSLDDTFYTFFLHQMLIYAGIYLSCIILVINFEFLDFFFSAQAIVHDLTLDELTANFSTISKYYAAQVLFYVNIYLLFISIIILFIFCNINLKITSPKILEKVVFFKKNSALIVFLISFILVLFMLQFNYKFTNTDITEILSSDTPYCKSIFENTIHEELYFEFNNFNNLFPELFTPVDESTFIDPDSISLETADNLLYDYAIISSDNSTEFDNFVNNFRNSGLNSIDIVLILLCYIIGFFSFLVLGDRVWLNNSNSIILLLYFPLIILLLTQAKSLLEIFLYYELLMLPSVYLVNKLSYSNKSHTANLYFFV